LNNFDTTECGGLASYVTSHPGQLSLAIPPWVSEMSTSESWGVNGHTARHPATMTFYGMMAILNVVNLATCFPENCLKLLPPTQINFFQNSL